ncbi:dihydroxyacetone kinase subunit DhaK [Mycolicibacterium goodii]|uniref:Dihydroxyacetone kinase n=1 Tax=Mycolicibacterium goodii TaxID=134601 RepID=A0A0K0X3D2_MYCGD|nr:dihydroxyacetone kinase [Mycolicibacterium goodii]
MTSYLMNQPHGMVSEAVEGFVSSHPDIVRVHRDPLYVSRTTRPAPDKVTLVSGGGSGHEPLHTGFVGTGMLDAAVPGAVFSSPTAIQVRAAIEDVGSTAGTVLIVKNYTGDVLNFSVAAELLQGSHDIETVLVDDDLATKNSAEHDLGGRGTAAVVVVEKACGAAAEAGATLTQVRDLGRDIVARSATLSAAFDACTNPLTGRRSFELQPGELEFGIGIHGERGIETRTKVAADELVDSLLAPIVDHLSMGRGDRALLIVNGLGATHPLELAVAARAARRQLQGCGIGIARSLVGNYVTALDMHGVSLTLTAVDDTLIDLWDAPVRTAALTWGQA